MTREKSRVFQEPALRGINYRLVASGLQGGKGTPDGEGFAGADPLIFIDKLAMTRRQLLWSLSQDHQLHMTPVFDTSDGPASIEIRSRAARNDARARGDR